METFFRNGLVIFCLFFGLWSAQPVFAQIVSVAQFDETTCVGEQSIDGATLGQCQWDDTNGCMCEVLEGPVNTNVPTPAEAPSAGSFGGGGLIEPCALQTPQSMTGGQTDPYCRDVNDLLNQLIRIARYLFGIIGSLALLFFVYGGMTMILSFGSPEKFKQGKDIMVAAVVGMMIAFSAYIVINFVLDALGVTSDFRGV